MESDINLQSLSSVLAEDPILKHDNKTNMTATPILMGLPVEIRLHIFSMVTEDDEVTCWMTGSTAVWDPSSACEDFFENNEIGLTALTCTCKQFHEEVGNE